MRIKVLDKLARLMPKRIKQLYANWAHTDVETRRSLLWEPDFVIEFWMDGFNDEGLDKAFAHIVAIYDLILHEDSNWHYFYEDHYSLIRCSFKYQYKVKQYLDENNINYKWPVKNWTEGTYMTNHYQDIYQDIFHSISVLIVKMFKNEDGSQIHLAADRIIHPFFNHALYLADINGYLDIYKDSGFIDPTYWEAKQMAELTIARAHYIGKAEAYKEIKEQMKENGEEE